MLFNPLLPEWLFCLRKWLRDIRNIAVHLHHSGITVNGGDKEINQIIPKHQLIRDLYSQIFVYNAYPKSLFWIVNFGIADSDPIVKDRESCIQPDRMHPNCTNISIKSLHRYVTSQFAYAEPLTKNAVHIIRLNSRLIRILLAQLSWEHLSKNQRLFII